MKIADMFKADLDDPVVHLAIHQAERLDLADEVIAACARWPVWLLLPPRAKAALRAYQAMPASPPEDREDEA